MGSQAFSGQIYRFGLFEADVVQGTLTRNGVRVKIQEQPFRVLILLLERAGEIVAREELRAKLWPEGTFVDFDGSLNVILKKLRATLDDSSENPVFVETVPRRGYRFIAPVSTLSSSQVEASAEQAPASGEKFSPAETTASRKRTSRPLLYVAATISMICLGGAAWFGLHGNARLQRRPQDRSSQLPSVPLRKSVAVLGFYNTGGQPSDAWLGTALAEMLSTELSAGEKLRLVAGEDVANLRVSSPWSETYTLNPGTSLRLGTALSADFLVLGSYTSLTGAGHSELRIDVRLQNAKTGEILTEAAEIASRQELFPLVSRLGSTLRERLGVPGVADSEQAGVLASLPVDAEAARLYALGLAKLRGFDALGAKDLLLQVTEADPKFSLGHMMLSRAWSQLGYEQKRRDEIKKALALSQDLPRGERMLVEAEYQVSIGKHEDAGSTYHALFELFPDNVDYGLALANEQLMVGQRSQAAATLQQLRRLPAPASDDPRIDLTEARTSQTKPAGLALIRRALNKASQQQNKLLYAQARKEECLALLYSDSPAQAPASCQDAYNIFMAAGNRLGAADSLRLLADRLGTQGRLEDAIATYRRALAVIEGLGEYEKTGAILNNMAINFQNEGNLDAAERLYRQAKSNFEQAGDRVNACAPLVNLADVQYQRGKLSAAANSYAKVLEIAASLESVPPGYAMYRFADLQLTRGDVTEATRLAQQSINSFHDDQAGYLSGAMLVLGESLEAQGDLAGAREQFQKALNRGQKIGAADLTADSQSELAELALQEGHPEQAESLLRSAITTFNQDASSPAAASALVSLSRALTMQGKFDDARQTLQHAATLVRNTPDPALQLPIEIQSARLAAEKTDISPAAVMAAQRQLRATAATARKLGYYRLECEARLAVGEAETRVDPSAARAELSNLAAESGEHGFKLIAQRAQKLMARSNEVLATNARSH